jgi:hypothetical protein
MIPNLFKANRARNARRAYAEAESEHMESVAIYNRAKAEFDAAHDRGDCREMGRLSKLLGTANIARLETEVALRDARTELLKAEGVKVVRR